MLIGGTSGIGLGITQVLLHRGIITYSVGRKNLDADALHENLKVIQLDLTAPNAIEKLQKKLTQIQLDYIVFSAATEAPLKIFSEINTSEYDDAFLLNLKIPFFIVKTLLPNLNLNARLLFLTSRLASSPEVGSLIYSMTKAAIEIFSAGLNQELKNILLSSTVIPGLVDTEMQRRLREADPNFFPHTKTYQNYQSKLKSIQTVGERIAVHLCDTNDVQFTNQRVECGSDMI